MFTRRCQRLQIYAHKNKRIPVSLSSANPRAAARRENPKTPTSIIIHPPSSRPRALSSIRTYLGRREHATTAAHVTERPLARAVGTTARNARDSRHRATGSPRFRRGLVTGAVVHGVRLRRVENTKQYTSRQSSSLPPLARHRIEHHETSIIVSFHHRDRARAIHRT